ncbi:IclR family transcriptional regulator [Microbacterium sp. A93]|uniref:IclR family transcriptional regulator n=1 Tax=unclassified Microbacterium TaxID=2609290 RepID=UPI003F41E6AA
MRTAPWTETVSVLDRMTAILDAFSEIGEAGEGLGVTELARRANLPKSTVSRIAADLVAEGYLDRVGGRLYLGLRLFELGQSVERPRRLRRLAISAMAGLRDTTGHNVQLAIADGEDVVVIANARGRDAGFPAARIGERLPRATTALGAVFTAFEQRREQTAGAHDAVTTYEAFHGSHLCVASPVQERGHTVAALALSGTIGALDPVDAAPIVRRAATTISRLIAAS